MKRKKSFSLEAIKRLGLYLRNLKRLREEKIGVISSDKIAQFLNASPEQFRKDLSYFGGFGKRGVGYDVERLIREIENILGVNKRWDTVLVGAGKLGSALLGFDGFSQFNLKVGYVFDAAKDKIGKVKKGIKINDVKNMKSVVRVNSLKIAIITTPPEAAQNVANDLVASGIKGILNFAPIALKVPGQVLVSNVDMACELESLIFFAKRR